MVDVSLSVCGRNICYAQERVLSSLNFELMHDSATVVVEGIMDKEKRWQIFASDGNWFVMPNESMIVHKMWRFKFTAQTGGV